MSSDRNTTTADFEAIVERLFLRYGAGFDRLERRLDGISEQVNQVSADMEVLRERTANQGGKIDRIERDIKDVRSDFKQILEDKLDQVRREVENADKQHAEALSEVRKAYEEKFKTVEARQEAALSKSHKAELNAADYYAKINQMYRVFLAVSSTLVALIIAAIWYLIVRGTPPS